MKKVAKILLTIVVCLLASVGVAMPALAMEGSGTKENPYVITTAQELAGIRQNLSAYYVLGNDIDASSLVNFTPIGNARDGAFKGGLDGRGHTIKNLTVYRPDDKYVGLFGYSEGEISNIRLTNAAIAGNRYVGGIVGSQDGDMTGCSVQGTITASPAIISRYVGGVAGYVTGNVQGCSSNFEMTIDTDDDSIKEYVGGVAGWVQQNTESCSATGSVREGKLGYRPSSYYGGIVGYSVGSIQNCKAPNVTLSNDGDSYSGGIASYCGGNFINNTASGKAYAGLVNEFYGDRFELSDCSVKMEATYGICAMAVTSGTISLTDVTAGIDSGTSSMFGVIGSNTSVLPDVRFEECAVSGRAQTGYIQEVSARSLVFRGCDSSIVTNTYSDGAGYVGKMKSNATFADCTFSGTSNGAAFVCNSDTGDVQFVDCKSYGYAQFGWGYLSSSLFKNCVNYGDTYDSVFRGTAVNCANYGTSRGGAFSGETTDCINYGQTAYPFNRAVRCIDYSTGNAVLYDEEVTTLPPEELLSEDRFGREPWSEQWISDSGVAGGYPTLRWMQQETLMDTPVKTIQTAERFQFTAHKAGHAVGIRAASSDNTSVASVSSGGMVRGVSQGVTRIRFTLQDGSCLTAVVRVENPVATLRLPETVQVYKGVSTVWEAPVTPSDSIQVMHAEVEDIGMAAVSWSGNRAFTILGKETGKTKLTITTIDGVTGTTTLEILPGQVLLSQSELTLDTGIDYNTLRASVVPEGQTVRWSSSNPSVVSIQKSESNPVSFRTGDIGTAVLTATCPSTGASASCTVHVVGTEIRFEQNEYTLIKGETLEIGYYFTKDDSPSISWYSANSSIASVENGVVTAKAVGSTQISAYLKNGSSAVCDIIVRENTVPQSQLTLSQQEAVLVTGQTLTLTAELLPENASDRAVYWRSSNAGVASVNGNGVVTAISAGTTSVQAYTNENLVAECVIRVYADNGTTLTMQDAMVEPTQEQVTLLLAIHNNPGLAQWDGMLQYNPELLQPVSVQGVHGAQAALVVSDLGEQTPGMWSIHLLSDPEIVGDGDVLEICFSLKAQQPGDYTIDVATENDVVIGADGTQYRVCAQPAAIHVLKYRMGDANMDGVVDLLDEQFLAAVLAGTGSLQEEQIQPCDMNRDGLVDSLDLALLCGQMELALQGAVVESVPQLEQGVNGLIVGQVSAESGGQVRLPIYAAGTVGAAKITLEYDADVLTPVEVSAANSLVSSNLDNCQVECPGTITLSVVSPAGVEDGGELAAVTFAVSETAPIQDTPVFAKMGNEFSDHTAGRLTPAAQTGCVTVERPSAKALHIDQNAVSLPQGRRVQMTASLIPQNAKEAELVWQIVAGNEYASMTKDGILTAVAPGKAVVRVTMADNPTIMAEQEITITESVEPDAVLSLQSTVAGKNKLCVTMAVDRDVNTVAFQAVVSYDPSKLKLESVQPLDSWENTDVTINGEKEGKIYLVWESTNVIHLNGDLFSFDFDVVGDLSEQGTPVFVIDYGEETICMTQSDGKIMDIRCEPVSALYRILYGDVNGDGILSVMDAYLIRRNVAGLTPLTGAQILAGDVDGNDVLSVYDAYLLRRFIAGLIGELPVCQTS